MNYYVTKLLARKQTIIYYLLFIIVVNIYQLYNLSYLNESVLSSFFQLHFTLKISIYYFGFYSVFSFYYLRSNENTFLLDYNKIIIITILNIFSTLICIIYNLLAFISLNIKNDFIIHIIKSMVVNIFMIGSLGISLSWFLHLYFNKVISYILISICVFAGSPGFEYIVYYLYYNHELNFYPIFYWFNIYTPSLFWEPNFAFGYSILPYRIALIIFWTFLFLSLALLKIVKNAYKKVISVAISLTICLIGMCIYISPSSKLIMDDYPDSSINSERNYYKNFLTLESKPCFKVSKYQINIDVLDKMYVTLNAKVDKNMSEYIFTLYHGFKISNIKNQDDQNLSYTQDGDYITIQNNGFVSELLFTYSGFSNTFYTNAQGILLPGFFPYYPQPGYKVIFNAIDETYNNLTLDYYTEFVLKVNGYNIYTNIPEKNDGTYSGLAKSLTILSGYYESESINDIKVVYPYLNTLVYNKENLIDYTSNYISTAYDDINMIFFIPNLNLHNYNIFKLSDYLISDNLYV